MGPITTNSKRIKIKNKTTVLKSNTSLPSELSLDMFLSKQFPLTQKHLPYWEVVCTSQRHMLKAPSETHCVTDKTMTWLLLIINSLQRITVPLGSRGPRVLSQIIPGELQPWCPREGAACAPVLPLTAVHMGVSHRLVSSHTLTGML